MSTAVKVIGLPGMTPTEDRPAGLINFLKTNGCLSHEGCFKSVTLVFLSKNRLIDLFSKFMDKSIDLLLRPPDNGIGIIHS